jgi:hypothetical protein
VRENSTNISEDDSTLGVIESSRKGTPSASLTPNNLQIILDAMGLEVPSAEREAFLAIVRTELDKWNRKSQTNPSRGMNPYKYRMFYILTNHFAQLNQQQDMVRLLIVC